MAADISFKISADLADLRAALQGLRADFQQAGQNARTAFGDAGVAKIRGDLAGLRGDLQRTAAEGKKGFGDLGLDSIAGKLSGLRAGVVGLAASIVGAMGVRELIGVADAYTNINNRLRAATREAGNFKEVQGQLIALARDTRAPLGDVANLYANIAPALSEVGIGSARTVGVLRTVSQALALSGSSAESTGAALQQLAQGLGSNNLAGEELRSVLEQARPLAVALAEGMGVPVGKLKELAAQGEITAEVFATAIEKMAGRVAADFRDVDITVGQAGNVAGNTLLLFVGRVDEAVGASASLSAAIIEIADGFDRIAPSIIAVLTPAYRFIIDFIDVSARLVRVAANNIAGFAAALTQAVSGDTEGALETLKETARRSEEIILEPLAAQRVVLRAAREGADQREKIEADLTAARVKLENMRKVAAGEASVDILKSEKELATERNKVAEQAMKDRLKAEESTADKLRDLYAKSLADAQKARDDAARIRVDSAASADNLRDRASQRRGAGMSEGQREEMNTRAASTLTARATLVAGQAQVAARDGDLKKAEKLAAEAAKLAERAEKAADAIKDDDVAARALDDLARLQEKIGEAQAKQKEGEAAQLDKEAAATDQQVKAAEERIAAVKAELAKPITLQADITEAEKTIKTLEERLANLPDKTVTVSVQTVTQGATFADAAAAAPAKADGGKLFGPGSDRSDNLLVWASPNEWVINARASRYYGDEFMARLNSMQLPRFADGGPITPGMRSAANDSEATVLATLNFPGMSPVQARISRATHDVLARELRREARKAGR